MVPALKVLAATAVAQTADCVPQILVQDDTAGSCRSSVPGTAHGADAAAMVYALARQRQQQLRTQQQMVWSLAWLSAPHRRCSVVSAGHDGTVDVLAVDRRPSSAALGLWRVLQIPAPSVAVLARCVVQVAADTLAVAYSDRHVRFWVLSETDSHCLGAVVMPANSISLCALPAAIRADAADVFVYAGCEDGKIYHVSVSRSDATAIASPHSGWVMVIATAAAEDLPFLMSGSSDGSVAKVPLSPASSSSSRVLPGCGLACRRRSTPRRLILTKDDSIRALAMTSHDRTAVYGTHSGTISVVNPRTMRVIRRFCAPESKPAVVRSLAVLPGYPSLLVAAGSDGILRYWRWTSGEAVAVLPDAPAAGSDPGASPSWLVSWDCTQGVCVRETSASRPSALSSVLVHPNGRTVLAGDEDGSIVMWT